LAFSQTSTEKRVFWQIGTMKNKAICTALISVLIALVLSGCLDFLNSNSGTVTYEKYPNEIRYTVSYGYFVNCSGSGDYNIKYDCEVPQIMPGGKIISIQIHDNNYTDKTVATYNSMKSWNISSSDDENYDLGITVTIESVSFVVSDLNGANASSIQEIAEQHSDLVTQYCQAQSNETMVFINPYDQYVQENSTGVLNRAGTNNAFLVAKELFIWLKENTDYKLHLVGDNNVQPCDVTLQLGTGDCDDLSFLYMSLCRSVGIPARFIRGFLIEKDDIIPHEWVEIFVGGDIGNSGWIPVECAGTASSAETEVNQNFGLETADHLRLFKDDGSNESLIASIAGLSYVTYGPRIIEAESFDKVSSYIVLQESELVIDENGLRSYK